MEVTRLLEQIAPGRLGEPLPGEHQGDLFPRGGEFVEAGASLSGRS